MKPKKLKIAVIGLKGLPAFGGAAKSVESVVEILGKNFDFTLYEVDTHSVLRTNLTNATRIVFKGVKGKRLNTFLYYLRSILHCLFFRSYDIIHFQHLYGGFLIPLLRLRFKVITTAHGIIPEDDNKWNKLDKAFFRLFEFMSVYFSNFVVTVSKSHIQYLKNFTKNIQVIYIPNGVKLSDENFAKDNSNSYILFSAARIIQLKGLHTLLESLQKIQYQKKLVVIGDLEQVPSYKRQILNLASNLNIEFTSLIKEKSKLFEYIKNAQLFVFPSFNEGMSNMLLEVASMKTPIICSDIEENKAIFKEDEVLYFKVGDIDSLSEKLTWASNNYDCMLHYAANAYKRVQQEYSWDLIAKKYEELYLNLVSNEN